MAFCECAGRRTLHNRRVGEAIPENAQSDAQRGREFSIRSWCQSCFDTIAVPDGRPESRDDSTPSGTRIGSREMSIEYHGWVVLATSQEDWSDDDFESGYDQAAQAAASLPRDAGHEAVLPGCEVWPKVLYLKGSQVDSLDPALRAMEQVGVLFDRAYGELTAFDEDGLTSRWDCLALTRYCLIDGRLTQGGRRGK